MPLPLPERALAAPAPSLGRKFKVCLASLAPLLGGAEVAAERLALGLQAAGHDVFLLLARGGTVQERLERSGLRCLVSPLYPTDKWHCWRNWQACRKLRLLLRQERPNLVHSNDLFTHQTVAAVARQLGLPRVCHHRFPFDGPTIEWLNKYGAERHLFVSRALMDEMCAASENLRRGNRAVVYDGLPLPPVPTPEDRLRARARLGLPPDRVLVLFAGRIILEKGVADLLRAWSLLDVSLTARSELLLIGDDLLGEGAYRREMERLATELGCPARFFGFQNNVADWLIASDVAAVPSHLESLGNATLEAMAYGLPAIGCAVGGIPEMIVPGETGLLVPAHSPEHLAGAFRTLLGDEPLRRRLGAAGQRRCEQHFSLVAHTKAVLAEYARVVPNSPSRSEAVGRGNSGSPRMAIAPEATDAGPLPTH